MPEVSLSPVARQQFLDNDGAPYAGGKLYTYVAGSAGSVNKPTYTSSTGLALNSNPIVLDAAGRANLWLLEDTAYQFVLKDVDNNIVFDIDNVWAEDAALKVFIELLASGAGALNIGFQQDSSAKVRPISDKVKEAPLSPQDYPLDNSGDATSAFNEAKGALVGAGGWLNIPRNLKLRGNYVLDGNAPQVRGNGGVVNLDTGPGVKGLFAFAIGDGTSTVAIGGTTTVNDDDEVVAAYTWRPALHDIAISASNTLGGEADYALALYGGTVYGSFKNFDLRNGKKHTLHIEPTNDAPVTATNFTDFHIRQSSTSYTAAAIWITRNGGSDAGYATALIFSCGHINGPKVGGAAIVLAAETVGVNASFDRIYADCAPWGGAEIDAIGSQLAGIGVQLDPGQNDAVVVKVTNATAQADPTRALNGHIRIGAQRMKWNTCKVIGSIAGTVLTVTAVISGVIEVGFDIDAEGISRVAPRTATLVSSLGTGTGGIGTYNVSQAQAVAPGTEIILGPYIRIPAEADWYFYRMRAYNPYLGNQVFLTTALDPFNEDVYLARGDVSLVQLIGADLELKQDIFIRGASTGAAQGLFLSSSSPAGGGFIASNDVGQPIRIVPNAGTVLIGGDQGLSPLGPNYSLGGTPWQDIYTVNPVHVTSDGRTKSWVSYLRSSPDIEKYLAASDGIADNIGFFQKLDAIEAKGADKARLHFGIVMQEALEAFYLAGLEKRPRSGRRPSFRHSMFSYDKWKDQYYDSVDHETGERTKVLHRPAGDLYMIKPDEVLFFLFACERVKNERKFAALEARIGIMEAANAG